YLILLVPFGRCTYLKAKNAVLILAGRDIVEIIRYHEHLPELLFGSHATQQIFHPGVNTERWILVRLCSYGSAYKHKPAHQDAKLEKLLSIPHRLLRFRSK